MNSIPVQLPSVGGQLNVLGSGVQPSSAGDTAAGGDAFLGLLQQLLLGGALQMPVLALNTPQENGTQGSGGNGSEGETSPADGLAVLAVSESVSDLVSASPPVTAVQTTSTGSGSTGVTVQPVQVAQTSAEEADAGAPGTENAAVAVASSATAQAMEAILGMMEPVTGEQVTLPKAPVVAPVTPTTQAPDPIATITATEVRETVAPEVVPTEGDEAKPVHAMPLKPVKTAVDAKPVRRAGTLTSSSELSTKVPVSPKEGDKTPVRAQATAPASMVEATESEDLARMVRTLQHVAGPDGETADTGQTAVRAERITVPVTAKENEKESSPVAAVREQDGAAVKAVPASTHTTQENLHDALQHREQTFTPPGSPLTKVESGRTTEFSSRLPESLGTLPQETAKSVADQVIKGMALQVNGENSEVRIKLVPESLGEVTVHVRMESGKMQAQIDVSQVGVKSALELQLPQIRQSLSERGIDVQRLDVSFGGDNPARESAGGQSDRRQRQGSKRAYVTDGVDQVDTGRLMGYNTMEMVM